MSTKCPMTLRYQAKKRGGLDRQNSGPRDVQMITYEQNEHPKVNDVQKMADLLAITRS